MNDFVLQPSEKILKEDRQVLWLKSWLAKRPGRLVFTTQRLVFVVDKPPGFTASQLIANELANSVPIDIPRDALEAVEQVKHRKSDNAILIKTESESFKFLVGAPAKSWESTLREAMHDDKVALEHVLARLAPKDRPPPYR